MPAASTEEDMVAPVSTAAVAATAAVPVVTVSTSPEFPEMGLAENKSFHVRVTLKYEEMEALSAQKVPLDVVCVLDNSGSMSGGKLESLKKAMDFVIEMLGPHDRLSVVNFNSHPELMHGLLKMNSSNQFRAKTTIHTLRATGGTNILQGMQQGWSILESRRSKNPASCLFLLTDGQDRDSMSEKLELARTIKSSGTSLFVFGFGTDHDSEHMDAIATAAEGSFTYIESDSMVTDAFGGTIGAQQGQSLTDITLNLEGCERGVAVGQVLAGRYTHHLAADGRTAAVSFVNMFLGESRDILLKMTVPAVMESVEDYELVRASGTFLVQGQDRSAPLHSTQTASTCVVQRLSDDRINPLQTRDLAVDVQLNRVDVTETVTAALKDADSQNFTAARDVLTATRNRLLISPSLQAKRPVAVGLLQEVDDALQRVSSSSEYGRGGRAMMQECLSNNSYQRTTYVKKGKTNMYQTESSSGMQQRALMSKGPPSK